MITHLRTNAVAYLALFVALGGTSYAAVALPKNSVGAAQIKKDAVRSGDVKNGSLAAADFKAGQLPAGASGPTGPQGPAGVLYAVQGSTPSGAPPAVPQSSTATTTFTLPAAGKLFAYGTIGILAQCTGDESYELGLYLDDVPLPASARRAEDNVRSELTLTSVTAVVPAGEHTLKIGRTCDNGATFTGATVSSNYTVGALLVGG
jgi:hypothetical protein